MPKRKFDESQERTIKKLRRLEKKLQKYKDKLQQPEDCQESIENIENIHSEENTDHVVDEVVQDTDGSVELSQEFLEALGVPSNTETRFGMPINLSILQRFQNILLEGMKTEEKENILKELCFPENARLMQAPKLNIELTGVLTSTIKLRDKLLEERQEDTGYAIATICQAMELMTKPNIDVMTIVKKLSNATSLLCNLHFKYTDIRRKMISPLLDKNLDLNLKDNKRSEWLYSKLDDAVKSASAIKRATAILAPKKTKNLQTPRQPSHFHRGRGSARGGYQNQPRYHTRPPPRQNQYQARRPAPTPSSSRGMPRGRSRYP